LLQKNQAYYPDGYYYMNYNYYGFHDS